MHREPSRAARLALCLFLVAGCGASAPTGRSVRVPHAAAPAADGSAGAPSPDGDAAAEPARLVLLVVVDQLPPWQLERLRPFFTGGLARFLAQGQVWMQAEHDHGHTETGPGHATLSTGVRPARHGIVANEWRDEEGRSWNCVEDPSVTAIGCDGPLATERPASAWRLLEPGLAERVRAAAPRSRSLGIAGKDRSAILGAGRAELSLWWSEEQGGFVSSTAYGPTLPDWVARWDRGWTAALPLEDGRLRWSDGCTEEVARAGTAPDVRAGERDRRPMPHDSPRLGAEPTPEELARLAAWVHRSPFLDELVLELAARGLDALELGADDATDVLVLGLSACDIVGHEFGPRSHEVTDLLLRLDRSLGRFLERLDATVGAGRWVAALSSDHGVLELPEWLEEQGIPAARVRSKELKELFGGAIARLDEEFAPGLVAGADVSGLRFSAERVRAAGVDGAALRARAAELLGGADFVARAFPSDALAASDALASDDPLLHRMAGGFRAGRSNDVTLVLAPECIAMSVGTTHGSPWDYDRVVPLVLLGPGSPAERRDEPCRTIDVLPTLLCRAGLPVPDGLDGRVLPPERAP